MSRRRLLFIKSRTRYILPKGARPHWDGPGPAYYLESVGHLMDVEACFGVPAILQACSESRERAKRVYKKAWERGEGVCVHEEGENGDWEKERSELGWRYTWVNYTLDLIVFEHS